MTEEKNSTLALFYCQNTPGSGEKDRQSLEERYGKCLRLFPIPCSGRLDAVHLLRALEEFADAAYVITCPKAACRYFEGNQRAKKRVEMIQSIIGSIGLEEERVGIVIGSKDNPKSLAKVAQEIVDRVNQLGPSPVLSKVS